MTIHTITARSTSLTAQVKNVRLDRVRAGDLLLRVNDDHATVNATHVLRPATPDRRDPHSVRVPLGTSAVEWSYFGRRDHIVTVLRTV